MGTIFRFFSYKRKAKASVKTIATPCLVEII